MDPNQQIWHCHKLEVALLCIRKENLIEGKITKQLPSFSSRIIATGGNIISISDRFGRLLLSQRKFSLRQLSCDRILHENHDHHLGFPDGLDQFGISEIERLLKDIE